MPRSVNDYHLEDIKQREWLIPFMGANSVLVSSCLACCGVQARVLPTNTEHGYLLARKHIHTELCYPAKGVTGDGLAFLKQEEQVH